MMQVDRIENGNCQLTARYGRYAKSDEISLSDENGNKETCVNLHLIGVLLTRMCMEAGGSARPSETWQFLLINCC